MINNANSPSNHYYTWSILALSGLLASPIDTPSLGTAQGNTSGTDANVACAAALAQARNHVIGVMSSGQGANGINLLPPSGYTDIMTEQNGTANQTGQIAHLQTNAISTPNLAWSHDDNGSSWIASVVAYKLAAASSGRKVGGGRLKSKVRGV